MTLLSAIKSFSQLSIHGDLVKASVFPMLVNAPTLTVSRVTPSLPALSDSKGCGKCARTKKSGKNSCCARGGAWFKNCGDAGDMKFDHTWAEGIQACKSRLCRAGFFVANTVSLKLISLLAICSDNLVEH